MAILGYARVSTDGQDLSAQVAALTDAGCARIFREKASGARADRAELTRLLRTVGAGDTLIVTRLDRLARSTRDLLNVLHALSERGARFRSLADPWCDTTSPSGELLVTILAGMATFERHLIRSRTEEGRKRAMARGVRFGRRLKLTRHQVLEALARRDAGERLRDIALTFNVSHSTISRLRSDGVRAGDAPE